MFFKIPLYVSFRNVSPRTEMDLVDGNRRAHLLKLRTLLHPDLVLPPVLVYIGDDIQVKVLLIDRNKVRLGILAPDDILIQRSELCAQCDPAKSNAPAAEDVKVRPVSAPRVTSR